MSAIDRLIRFRTPALLLGVLISSLGVRFAAFNFESRDYEICLRPWYTYFVEHGRFAALKDAFSDYAPPYLYLLSLSTLVPVPPIFAIKAISVVFDYLLAFAMFKLVADRWQSPAIRFAAAAAPLFWPTVIMNGSVWGQCDVIFSSIILFALRACLQGRWRSTMILLGLAFSFKVQAVFALPAFGLIFLKQRGRFRDLVWFPLTFFASLVPAWIAGRPLRQLLTIYGDQAGHYSELSLGAPNMLQVFWTDKFDMFKYFGIWFAIASAVGLAALCAYSNRPLRPQGVILLLLSSALLFPFFLPLMHERYFFLADVVALLYVFWYPRRWWVAVAIVTASFFSYTQFLFNANVIGRQFLALTMGTAMLVVLRDLVLELYRGHDGAPDGAPTPPPVTALG